MIENDTRKTEDEQNRARHSCFKASAAGAA